MQRFRMTVVAVCSVVLAIASFARVSDASAPAPSSAPGTHYQTFTGARVTYQMPGAFLPAIQH